MDLGDADTLYTLVLMISSGRAERPRRNGAELDKWSCPLLLEPGKTATPIAASRHCRKSCWQNLEPCWQKENQLRCGPFSAHRIKHLYMMTTPSIPKYKPFCFFSYISFIIYILVSKYSIYISKCITKLYYICRSQNIL